MLGVPRNILGTLGLKIIFIFNIFVPWKVLRWPFQCPCGKMSKDIGKAQKSLFFGTTMQTRKDAKPGGGVPTPCRMSRDVGGVEKFNVFDNEN